MATGSATEFGKIALRLERSKLGVFLTGIELDQHSALADRLT